MPIQTVNPATGQVIQTYDTFSVPQLKNIIKDTHAAFEVWKEWDFAKRAKPMRQMADLLQQRKNTYATLIAEEMGKPLKQGIAEIEKCAAVCEHYADEAATYLKSRIISTNMKKSYVAYQPLGIIFAIMPWNFPFWQVFRFAAPTLMAGNAALLKHAPISTGSALAIENLFKEAGFLDNLFRTLVIADADAAHVIADPAVAAVTLTGSPGAGKKVGEIAASHLKKIVLELGGCDPYLILKDADLSLAAQECVTSRMQNAGQSCIAAKRLIVNESIHDAFVELVKNKVSTYKNGNPLEPTSDYGPLARADIRDKVHQQVQDSIKQGATLITGGILPTKKGFYYPATILTNVKKGMPAFDEEIFGPVISIIKAKDENEAIAIANDTSYGLGGAIFSQDVARAEKIAVERINTGSCAINTFLASDPRLPFGGIKNSGHGRELSQEGILSFVNVKTIIMK